MYLTTTFYIGDTVYFTDDGASVLRCKVAEIRVVQDCTGTSTCYLLTYGNNNEIVRKEHDLCREPGAAFRAWDREQREAAEAAATEAAEA